jgi:hypothetical protein
MLLMSFAIQNPQMDMQAMDRCHRIGQTRPVHVYRLITAHSVEVTVILLTLNQQLNACLLYGMS